ncbi:MAG: helix-turn-helix domain-containing protein [Pseudonocardiaceae bacterium]
MFAPARLRGYRHLRGLDHTTLATAAHTTPQTLAAIENGHTTPSTRLITTLAQALDCPPTELHTTGDPHDNSGYWDVICAALPPLTHTEITTAATALRRATGPGHANDRDSPRLPTHHQDHPTGDNASPHTSP